MTVKGQAEGQGSDHVLGRALVTRRGRVSKGNRRFRGTDWRCRVAVRVYVYVRVYIYFGCRGGHAGGSE